MSTDPNESLGPMPSYHPPVKLDPLVFPGAAPPFEQATRAGPPPAAPLQPPCVPGYEILDEVGRGGMGVVYRARELALKRLVALKIILSGAHASAKELQRFRAEAEAVARLQHPNIVQIYQVGETLGLPYLALEFCGGGTLGSKMRGRRLEPRQAAALVQTLAQAMQAAHERNVVHRDLKPDNILISHVGSDANTYWPVSPNSSQIPGPALLRITDFGLAKILDESRMTSSGAILGTPCYMAPEQARGGTEQVGPATDIYALGVLLYEMLTGRPPFDAPSGLDTLMQVIAEEPTPPRKLFPHVPRDLDLICLKCLRKNAAQRYASAAGLAEDLRRFLAGEKILAQPDSWLGRTRRWFGPYRAHGVVGALAVVILALVVLLWHYASQARRLTGELADAKKQVVDLKPSIPSQADRLRTAQLMRVDGLALRDAKQALAILHDKALFPPDQQDPAWHFYADLCRRAGVQVLGAQVIGVPCLAFSHDGKWLASGSETGVVRLWDTMTPTGRDLGKHAKRVLVMAWSPDDSRLASADNDGSIILWDVAAEKLGKTWQGHRGRVVGLAWHADGKTLTSAGTDGMVRVWNTAEGTELTSWKAGATLLAMARSPDGTLATAADDHAIRLWDAATHQVRAVLYGHSHVLHDLAFRHDGKSLASGSEDGTVRLWDLTSAKRHATLRGHQGGASAVAWHPSGGLLASAGGDRSVRLWNTATGQEQAVLRGLPSSATWLTWSPDGTTLAIGSFRGPTIHLWQPLPTPARGTLVWQPLGPVALALSADGRWLATAVDEHTTQVVDRKTGKTIPLLRGATLKATSPSGKWIASAQGGTVVVKEAGSQQRQATLQGDAAEITALLWSTDSRTLATACDDGTIQLWHVATGEQRAVLRGHSDRVTALAWSSGGQFLVKSGADSTIKLWQVGATSRVKWAAATGCAKGVTGMDHDRRFKTLIKMFFVEFLLLFLPTWAKRLNAAAVQWLDKEIFPDPPEGPRRVLDLVGKVPTLQAVPGQRLGEPEHWSALVHIEIESPDKATPLRPRMCDAYRQVRGKYGLPVVPIALYLKVALNGIGTDAYVENFWELEVERVQYLYVGLPGLNAVEYVQGDNWLGVALAALMHIPPDQVAWVGAEALRRLQTAPLTEQQRFHLADCVQAYLPLDAAQQRAYDQLLTTEPYQGVQAMNLTSFEKGIEKERREFLRDLLEQRFGPLSAAVLVKLEKLPLEQLLQLRKAVLQAASLSALGLDV